MTLNPQQQAARDYTSGPLLVLAGAGSGKTRVITEKIVHLVRDHGILPEKIAAITFTNKAAREMRSRASALLKTVNSQGLIISTFHSLGARMLRELASKVGRTASYSIFDPEDVRRLLVEILPKGSDPKQAQQLAQRISFLKAQGLGPEDLSSNDLDAVIAELYADYETALQRNNAVDFDDLIYLPGRLLNQDKEVRQQWQMRLRHVLVDEYQDTNACQYQMLKNLVGADTPFTAVGDDDQSIYGWRGAQPENLHLLKQDYPQLKLIKLEQNYRSSATILNAANHVIANNPHQFEKRLWSALGDGDPIRVIGCGDAAAEAGRVVSEIQRRRMLGQLRYDAFAILYRSNHQARDFEQALRLAEIPYHLSGGMSFFDRAEVKDALAYLRLIANASDDAALRRIINIPRRGIGQTTVERLTAHSARRQSSLRAVLRDPARNTLFPAATATKLQSFDALLQRFERLAKHLSPARLLATILEETHYSEYLKAQHQDKSRVLSGERNLADLTTWLERLDQRAEQPLTLAEILSQLALASSDDDDADTDQVRLMTLHAAKGLEFPHVFMVGVEEGILPHQNSIDEGGDHEERRLMYVGITRAQQSLTISYTKKRTRYGETAMCKPSRFIQELPGALIRQEGDDPELDANEKRERAQVHLEALRAKFGA